MNRFLTILFLCMAFVVGCGGVKPYPFSEKSRPLAEALREAVNKQDKAAVDRAVTKAEQYHEQNVVRSEELTVFKAVQDQAAKEPPQWDAARELITKSLEIKNR